MDKRRFDQKFDQLTGQQERVLLKLLAGETDPAIAQSLKIEVSTVRKHVQLICEKFDLQDEIYKH
jgi:DNA-binding NarL/FixJ family response regulator